METPLAERIENTRRKQTLEYYEREITKAGNALAGVFRRLRDDREKPWLCEYESFEDYCLKRWNMTPRRQQQIMAAESVRDQLAGVAETAGIAPMLNERQLREIKGIEPEHRPAVIEAAKAISKRMPTRAIKQARARVIEGEIVTPDAGKSVEPTGNKGGADRFGCCPTCKRPYIKTT